MTSYILKDNLKTAITAIILLCCQSPIIAQEEDTVGQLTEIIINGPSLYRTPEAVEYYSRHGVSATSMESKRDAAIQSLRAAVKLGNMGLGAKSAIPVLIDVFPQLEHVVAKLNVNYSTGNGSMEDWVQTFLVSEKNNFVFSSPFIEFETMSKCENWIEATPVTNIISQRTGKGGRIIEATADIFIILRVNAGACALGHITGKDLGANREAWQKWYKETGHQTAMQDSASQPDAKKKASMEIITGQKYKLHLVTGDELFGTVVAKDDSSMVLKTDAGSQYNFATILIDKYTAIDRNDSTYVKPQTTTDSASVKPTQTKAATVKK
jgi:hypothetical protein